jgi:hypothetical protein
MANKNSLAELQRRVEASLPRIRELAQQANQVALQEGLGVILHRIFNDGKDAAGNSLGQYSDAYAAVREAEGFQIAYKDFQRRGDLFRSIEVVSVDDTTKIGITNDGSARISQYLEEQIGSKTNPRIVFAASEAEADQMAEVAQNFLIDGLEQIIASWAR